MYQLAQLPIDQYNDLIRQGQMRLGEPVSLIAEITRNYHAYGDNYIAMIRQYVDGLNRCDKCINGWINLLGDPLHKVHCPKCDGSGFMAKNEHA